MSLSKESENLKLLSVCCNRLTSVNSTLDFMDLRKASPANCQFPGLILNLLLGEDSQSDNLNFSNFPKLSQSRIATTGSNCLKPHLLKRGAIMPPWPQWAAIKASLFPPWAARRSQSSLSFPVESWSVKNAGNLILSPAASFALLIMLLLWCTLYTGCVLCTR